VSAALGLAAFLLIAPDFVLPALALLLIVSGPSTLREWWWIVASVLWVIYSLGRVGLFEQTELALGVLVAGAFVVTMLRGPRTAFAGALRALVLGGAGLAVWGAWFGVGWQDVKLAFLRELWGMARLMTHPEFYDGGSPSGPAWQSIGDQIAGQAGAGVMVMPGILALVAVGGLVMAWSWYHRISRHPIGRPLGRLADFRFSDQLVWGVVAGLGIMVLPAPAPVRELAGNVTLFFGGLFAVRGLAVTRTWLAQAPGPLLLFMALSLMFFAPVALGGLLSLGLADTWLDFRRRMTPPTVEG
jgi:hypothetical protein